MDKTLQDAETRTPLFSAPQNTSDGTTSPETQPQKPAGWPPLPDRLAMVLCPVLGYFFWIAGEQAWQIRLSDTLVWQYGYLLFCILFCAGAALYGKARRPDGRLPKEAPLWLGCTLIMGVGITFDRLNAVPGQIAWLVWIAFAGYTVLLLTGQLTGDVTGPALAADALRGVGQGFAGLITWPKGLWQWATAPRTGRGSWRRTLAVVLCVAMAAVLFCVAAGWLGAADENFADVIDRLTFWKNWHITADYIIFLYFSVPTGAFFYGISAGGLAAVQSNPRPALTTRRAAVQKLRSLPSGLGCGILYAFCGLYAVFFVMQSSYLFGALAGKLPQGFTVANYARQGFFELCGVMLLNLGLLLSTDLLCISDLRGHKGLKAAAALLLGESLLLWVTAAAKLGLYIFTFGFTAKRLLAAWALLVLACAALRTLVSLWRHCAIVRPTVLLGAATFALLYLY